MTDLQNAIALVTGASRGLGRAIAFGRAEIGVNVVGNYEREKMKHGLVPTKSDGVLDGRSPNPPHCARALRET